jgi:hypothetical protein
MPPVSIPKPSGIENVSRNPHEDARLRFMNGVSSNRGGEGRRFPRSPPIAYRRRDKHKPDFICDIREECQFRGMAGILLDVEKGSARVACFRETLIEIIGPPHEDKSK